LKKNIIAIIIITAVIVGVLSFFGGIQYQKTQAKSFSGNEMFNKQGVQVQKPGQQVINKQNGNRGNNPVNGEITAIDDKSITVKTLDGNSKIIVISNETTVSKTEEAKKTDLKVGEKIAAFGTSNSDGTITALNIQLNPSFKNNPLAK